MTDEECFSVVADGRPQRWTIQRPVDHHGDGYVHEMLVEVTSDGLSATSPVTFEGQTAENVCDFLTALAADWRGWRGVRSWTSMGSEMTLEATHDGTALVRLAVVLRHRPHCPDAWTARMELTVEAGEQLRQLADAAEFFLRPQQ